MKAITLLFLLILLLLGCSEPKIEIGQITTNKGKMLFTLYEDTPIHKESFIKLANAHYWDSLTFNRVVEDFVIQGGCPDTPAGFSDSPYLLQPEFRDSIKHIYGALGAGRDGNEEKLSAGCQLYIVDNKDGIPRLDGDYMIFGQMLKGYDVLDAISKVEVDSTNTPVNDITMKVRVIEMTLEEIESLSKR